MTLHRGVAAGDRLASSAWLPWTARIGALALFVGACMTPPTRMRKSDAGEEIGGAGDGGSGEEGGSGGAAGSGGAGGSTAKLDAGPQLRLDAGAGGAGPDASVKLDGNKDMGTVPPGATWEKFNLVLANCVFCHNNPAKRLDLQETGLYERIVNAPAARAAAGCTNKTVVVPGQPMMSLLYLKLAGLMPSTCGERMPYKKPPVSAVELKIVFDWITAGAPMK